MRFTKIAAAALASAGLCFTPTAAMATACQAGPGGCVLPLPGPPPVAAPPVAAPPVSVPVAEPIIEAGGGGIGILPIVAGLVALGLLTYFLLDDDEESISV